MYHDLYTVYYKAFYLIKVVITIKTLEMCVSDVIAFIYSKRYWAVHGWVKYGNFFITFLSPNCCICPYLCGIYNGRGKTLH